MLKLGKYFKNKKKEIDQEVIKYRESGEKDKWHEEILKRNRVEHMIKFFKQVEDYGNDWKKKTLERFNEAKFHNDNIPEHDYLAIDNDDDIIIAETVDIQRNGEKIPVIIKEPKAYMIHNKTEVIVNDGTYKTKKGNIKFDEKRAFERRVFDSYIDINYHHPGFETLRELLKFHKYLKDMLIRN